MLLLFIFHKLVNSNIKSKFTFSTKRDPNGVNPMGGGQCVYEALTF